jgi:serine/threonine protein kinase
MSRKLFLHVSGQPVRLSTHAAISVRSTVVTSVMYSSPLFQGHISIILREVLKGLEYLHSERKLHRDIKVRYQP